MNYEVGTEVEFSLDAGSDPVLLLETLPPVGGSQVRLCTLEVVEVTQLRLSDQNGKASSRWTLAFPAFYMELRQQTAPKAPLIFSLTMGRWSSLPVDTAQLGLNSTRWS